MYEIDIVKLCESKSRISEIFKNCPFQILKSIDIVTYNKGKIIISQGYLNNYLYLIVSGKVEIYRIANNGKRHTNAFKQEGDLFGELEIFNQIPSVSYAEAICEVKLVKIKRNILFKWMEQDTNFDSYLIKYLCNRFCDFSLTSSEKKALSLENRLCKYLLSKCKHYSDSIAIEIKFDKKEICKVFGVTLRTLNRILKKLHDKNIIDFKNSIITITNKKKLIGIYSDSS